MAREYLKVGTLLSAIFATLILSQILGLPALSAAAEQVHSTSNDEKAQVMYRLNESIGTVDIANFLVHHTLSFIFSISWGSQWRFFYAA